MTRPKSSNNILGMPGFFSPDILRSDSSPPLESYPNSPGPKLQNHLEMASKVDEVGFSAIWLRDVPFWDPNFGDVGQILDPMVYAGYLAVVTKNVREFIATTQADEIIIDARVYDPVARCRSYQIAAESIAGILD